MDPSMYPAILPIGRAPLSAPTPASAVASVPPVQVLSHSNALYALSDRYSSAFSFPNKLEVAQMDERAVEVITILREHKQVTCPSSTPLCAPEWPREDTTNEAATSSPGPSPPADRIPSPVTTSSSSTFILLSSQKAQMTVFDGQPERHSNLGDKAKAVAIRDMEDIRARRGNGQGGNGKVKYKKRSRTTPPGGCHSCEISDTPEWRRGPEGQCTLCNACGLHYAKLERMRRYSTFSNYRLAGIGAPPIDIAFLRKCVQLKADHPPLCCLTANSCCTTHEAKLALEDLVVSGPQPSLATSDDDWDLCDGYEDAESTTQLDNGRGGDSLGKVILTPIYSIPRTLFNFRRHLEKD